MTKGARVAVLFVVVVVIMIISISASAQKVHIVGDEFGWNVPSVPLTYIAWAGTQNFTVGDILVFNFTTGDHNVAQVTKEAFLSCNKSIPTVFLSNTGPTNITLNTSGENYFFSALANDCELGQKLAIYVSEASSSPPTPLRGPVKYIVGDESGWISPTRNPFYYLVWIQNKTFLVGDTLEFNFYEGSNDVVEVSQGEFLNCSSTVVSNYTKSPALITLTTEGMHFYQCTINNNCYRGQKLAINVTGTANIATPPTYSVPPPSESQKTSTDGNHAPPLAAAAAGFYITLLLCSVVAYLMF